MEPSSSSCGGCWDKTRSERIQAAGGPWNFTVEVMSQTGSAGIIANTRFSGTWFNLLCFAVRTAHDVGALPT